MSLLFFIIISNNSTRNSISSSMRSLAAKQLAIDHSLCVAQRKTGEKKNPGLENLLVKNGKEMLENLRVCNLFSDKIYLGIV